MHCQYRRPMSHDLPLNIYRKNFENKPLLPSPPFIIIPELALGASILVSTFHYGRSVGFQGSVLLDNGLVTALNETLFERQRLSHFSIDPTPYTGTDLRSPKPSIQCQERRRVLLSPSRMLKTFCVSITKRILVFQSRVRTPGMSCLVERGGTFAALY